MNINKTVWSDVGDPRVVFSSCFYSMIKIKYVERAPGTSRGPARAKGHSSATTGMVFGNDL